MKPQAGAVEAAGLRRELRLIDLVAFNVVATLVVQLIAAFAHVGPVAIPLHIAAAALFFAPCAMVIATLSRRFPEEGGFYIWTRQAFGEWHAFLCGWCWWISVLLYLPGLMLIGAGMAAQAAKGAAVVENSQWLVTIALVMLWLTVGVNLIGLRVGKWLNNAAGGLLYAGGAIVLVACLVFRARYGSATSFTFHSTLTADRISLWAQIAFAYTGLELGSLMG